MPDLRQLRAFVAIAEEGHITRAAARLRMQQPPLTRLLHALERELGVPLMERFPKGVRPTAAGAALLDEARAVLQRADGIGDIVQRAARGEQGRLAVGFTSSSALHPFVPNVIRVFRQTVPGVAVVLDEAGTGELVDALIHERLDAAFVRSALTGTPALRTEKILDEPMVLALPNDHPLAAARALTASADQRVSDNPSTLLPRSESFVERQVAVPLAALAGEAFVLYRRPAGPGLYDAVLAACKSAGFSPMVVQEAPRMTATLSLVAAGLGISIFPASTARLRSDGITFLPLTDCGDLSAPLYLATRAAASSPACERFVQTATQLADGELPRSSARG